MSVGLRSRIVLVVQLAVFAICLVAVFSGGYPPAHAQAPLSVQDVRIEDINDRVKNNDNRINSQWAQISALAADIHQMKETDAHNQGVVQGFGALLTLMVGGSITLQIRKK